MPFRAMLDTNIVSVLMREQHGNLRQRLEAFGSDDVCMSIVAAGELYFGIAKTPSSKAAANLDRMLKAIPTMPIEPPVEVQYGNIRAALQRAGTPIGSNDTWIAAHALSLGLTLVTANIRKFSRVPDLRIENWLD